MFNTAVVSQVAVADVSERLKLKVKVSTPHRNRHSNTWPLDKEAMYGGDLNIQLWMQACKQNARIHAHSIKQCIILTHNQMVFTFLQLLCCHLSFSQSLPS